jgi:ribosomal protein S6--L-glutamate ligase
MDIAILTRDSGLYANRRLAHSALQRGASLRFIDLWPVLDPNTCSGPLPDAVIARYMPRWQHEGDRQLRVLESAGVAALNSADAIALARSMAGSQQCLRAAQIPMPLTHYFPHGAHALGLADLPFGFPMVIKREHSAQGEYIHRLANAEAAIQAAAKFQKHGQGFVLQEFIAEAGGCDVRLFVLHGRVLAAMKRCARAGEFRANVHQGGRTFAYTPSRPETEMACKAVAALGLSMAGVDLIVSKSGPLLLEVNACPGFEALERVSGVDIAGEILDLLIGRQN